MPIGDHASQQIGPSQQWAVGGRRATKRDMVTAAGAGVTAVEHEFFRAETRKPRSGRPVTPRALATALKGGELSGPAKSRLLKAVNHILEQKKQEKLELKALF